MLSPNALTFRQPSPPPPAPSSPVVVRVATGSGRRRVFEAGAGGLLVLAALPSDMPGLTLLGLVVALGAPLRGRRAAAERWSLALLILVGIALMIGLAGWALDVSVVPSGRWLTACHLLLVAGCVLAAHRMRRPSHHLGRADHRPPPLLCLPAALALAAGLLQPVDDRAIQWLLTGTDVAEHVVMLGDVQRAGMLSYSDGVYPRAWQMALALVSSNAPPARSAELLRYDIDLYAATMWLLLALVVAVAAVTTYRLAFASGFSGRTASLAGLATSSAILLSSWIEFSFIRMGSAPALLGVLALWALHDVGRRSTTLRSGVWTMLAATGMVTMLMAHLWQGLVLAPGAAFLAWFFAVRTGDPATVSPDGRRRSASGESLLAGLALVLAAACALPPLVSLLAATSIQEIAAAPGDIVGPPLTLLALTALTPLAHLRVGDRACRATAAGTAAGLLLLVVHLLVSSGQPLDLGQYYPRKAMAVLVLAALPWTASGLLLAGRSLLRAAAQQPSLRRRRGLLRGLVALGLLLGGLSLIVPAVRDPGLLVQTATSSVPDEGGARRLLLAQQVVTGEGRPLVLPSATGLVSSGDYPGSFVISKLLRFRTGQRVTSGRAYLVCEEAQALGTSRDVLVVTDLPPRVMAGWMASTGCGDYHVKHVPGGDEQMIRRITEVLEAAARPIAAAPS